MNGGSTKNEQSTNLSGMHGKRESIQFRIIRKDLSRERKNLPWLRRKRMGDRPGLKWK